MLSLLLYLKIHDGRYSALDGGVLHVVVQKLQAVAAGRHRTIQVNVSINIASGLTGVKCLCGRYVTLRADANCQSTHYTHITARTHI